MILETIHNKMKKGEKMHFSLIDPDPAKITLDVLEERLNVLKRAGTDAIMIGGSTIEDQSFLDKCTDLIKEKGFKTILFPGDKTGLTLKADSIFFISLMNSTDPYRITGVHAQTSLFLAKTNLEIMSTAYLLIEPGMKAGQVGKADLIKRDDYKRVAGYAKAAELFGMKLVYLEAGSGADKPVDPNMIKFVKENLKIPLIVGGGIRTKEAALDALKAGADIIVTGTIIENDISKIEEIVKTIKSYR